MRNIDGILYRNYRVKVEEGRDEFVVNNDSLRVFEVFCD